MLTAFFSYIDHQLSFFSQDDCISTSNCNKENFMSVYPPVTYICTVYECCIVIFLLKMKQYATWLQESKIKKCKTVLQQMKNADRGAAASALLLYEHS
jgi:hypothetical protein